MLPLNKDDSFALHVALEQAYRSFAMYDRMLHAFRPTRPIERIRDVQAFHIRVLECLHSRYGVLLPKDGCHMQTARPTDASAACATAIKAEKEQLVLFRGLLQSAHDADVLAQLRNLERASRDGHLPKLQVWARQLAERRRKPAGTRLPHAKRPVGGGHGSSV
jgi:hypothetical protein